MEGSLGAARYTSGDILFIMNPNDPPLLNLQAVAHNAICRYNALKHGDECRGWSGEQWSQFCDKVEDLRVAVAAIKPCEHRNETLIRESTTTGRVICRDCGHEREWDAY